MTTRILFTFVLFAYINALPIDQINDSNNHTVKTSFTVKEKETITLKCPSNSGSSKTDEGVMLYDSDLDENEIESSEDYERKRRENDKNSFLIVQWYKDTSRINKLTASSRYKLLNNNNDLRIKNVNMNDAGVFKCKQINGFGGSVVHSLSLIVEASNTSTTTRVLTLKQNSKQSSDFSAPLFVNDKTQSRSYRKQRGSEVRFKCKATAVPKPDIMWFKNGEILTEEEYGITRSKWTLDLKDLRMSDNGNFTCQVFNKYGYINATFELIVYEDSQIFEGLDPLNATIIAGMDAVFNCKVKSNVLPDIKWMKQISKSEYSNYVQQNNINMPLLSTSQVQSNDDILKSFYQQLSTQSPYVNPEFKSMDSTIFSINDLLNSNNADIEDNEEDLKLFSLNKQAIRTKKNDLKTENDESVHYITLTSSPLVDQQITFNKIDNYYVSKLTIKHTSVKDTGIYVCFGSNLNGQSSRKSFLRVVPSQFSSIAVNEFNNQLSKLNFMDKKDSTDQVNYQSIGILIVLIPVLIITSFSIISICYLKQINDSSEKKTSMMSFFKSIFGSAVCCCCGSSQTNKTNLMQDGYKTDDSSSFKRKKSKFSFISTSSVRTSGSENGTTKSSLGSSLSTDSSSTTATTVAYYTTIPLLAETSKNNCSPPKLPSSQPPSFQASLLNPDDKLMERCTSTPSMAYYKIVDNEMIGADNSRLPINNNNNIRQNEFRSDDTSTCVSTNSRLYYQLTPMPVVHHFNYR